jgi:mitochondrial chaperone BCS1
LFDELPEKCLVLLEDIDSAGISNRSKPIPAASKSSISYSHASYTDDLCSYNGSNSELGDGEESADTAEQMQREARHEVAPRSTSGGSRVSLSGLLNAPDGVASHEGRILIITTNHLDQLDGALLRLGRIDVRVRFELASRVQIENLFIQMYSRTDPDLNSSSLSSRTHDRKSKRSLDRLYDQSKITDMARQFSAQIPNSTFSIAEIQGFLMTRKKESEEAIAQVSRWVANRQNK